MIEISKGVYVIDVDKFKEVYEARKDSVNVLSVGVKERMELYKIAINDSRNNKTDSTKICR